MPITIDEAKKLPTKTPEQRVREILEKEFGKSLQKKRIKIGNRVHPFDLGSEDGTILGEVKSGEQFDSTRGAEICLDCLYLMSVKSEKKILVLTNKHVYDSFLRWVKGLPIKDICIRFIPLKKRE